MYQTHRWISGLCLTLVLAAGISQADEVLSVVLAEQLPGVGVLPTIAVDNQDRPHVVADRGISRAGINIFDRINDVWQDHTFDSYTLFGSTQFFNPHLEIDPLGRALCGAISFGNLGMATIVRSGMDTDTPSSPSDGYSVHLIQSPWDAGEVSIDFALSSAQYVISSSFGRARIYNYDANSYGDIAEVEYRQMFAGNGGEKNAFWISRAGLRDHEVTGRHSVWHGAIGGYASSPSSYQNSLRHDRGLGPIGWASYSRYPIMEDDGTYVDVKSDALDTERAYMTSDFKHDGGVCVNIYDPDTDAMVFPATSCLTVDVNGGSGLRRFAPQLAPAKNGGVWISWSSRGGVYVRHISPTGDMGTEYRVGDGALANVCVDSEGFLHVVYSNGNLQYQKLEVTGSGGSGDDILMMAPISYTPFSDLGIDLLDTPNPVGTGSNLVYTITVTNRGPSRATGVTVTDTIPTGFDYLGAGVSAGVTSTNAAGIFTWSISELSSGQGAIASVTGLVVTSGSLTNAAQVVGAYAVDSNTANNTDETVTVITPPPPPPKN